MSGIADQRLDINDRNTGFLFSEGGQQLQDEIRARRKTAFASTAMCDDLAIDALFLEELCELLGNDHDAITTVSTNYTYFETRHNILVFAQDVGGFHSILIKWKPPHYSVVGLDKQSKDLLDEEAEDVSTHIPGCQFEALADLITILTHHLEGTSM